MLFLHVVYCISHAPQMDGNSGGTYIDIVEEFSSYHNSGCNDIGLTRVCTTTEVQYLLKYSNVFFICGYITFC
jgi:hypothetical protein